MIWIYFLSSMFVLFIWCNGHGALVTSDDIKLLIKLKSNPRKAAKGKVKLAKVQPLALCPTHVMCLLHSTGACTDDSSTRVVRSRSSWGSIPTNGRRRVRDLERRVFARISVILSVVTFVFVLLHEYRPHSFYLRELGYGCRGESPGSGFTFVSPCRWGSFGISFSFPMGTESLTYSSWVTERERERGTPVLWAVTVRNRYE